MNLNFLQPLVQRQPLEGALLLMLTQYASTEVHKHRTVPHLVCTAKLSRKLTDMNFIPVLSSQENIM